MAVCGVPQYGEGGPGLRQRYVAHALWGHRVYGHTRCPVSVVEQNLDDQAPHRVAHENRRLVELSDDAFVVLDYGGDRKRLDRRGVLVERLDLYLEAWVGRSEHAIAAALVALDPVLPASGGHPEPMDQDDGVWSTRIRGVVLGGHEDLLSQLGQLAKRPECGSDFFREQLRLLPRREVATLLDLVEVGKGAVRPPDPAARGRPDLAGEGGEAHRDRDLGRSLGGRGRDSGGSVALQYDRAADAPVPVSQYSVMLSRMWSRVRLPVGCP